MRVRGSALIALLCIAATAVSVIVPSARAEPGTDPAPLLGPARSGAGTYEAGTFVWTDYAYDDRGASSSSGADGAVSYPAGASNGADLVQVQVHPHPDGVAIVVLLETLLDPALPVVGVGLDTDRNPSTGAAALPGGAWPAQGPLGLEHLVVVRHGGAVVRSYDGSTWTDGPALPAVVDPGANTMSTTIPSELVAQGGSTWDVVALAGVARSGVSWVDGGPIQDLAFVADERPSGWQSAIQGDVLSGRAPARLAFTAVDLGAMADGFSTPPAYPAPGFHTRLYRSDLDLGEGVGQASLTLPGGREAPVPSLYAGPYQPYLVWVGDDLPDAPPLVVYMHGFSGTHTSSSGSFGPPQAGASASSLFLGNGGFTPSAIVLFPLGRGEQTFYMGAAEQDVLDVTDDALAAFGADPDRVVLSGVSMGGFGTLRLGTRYPDRWSALVPFIGTGGSPQYEFAAVPGELRDQIFSPTGFPTGNAELLENLINIPVRMINGQADPIVNNALVTQDVLRLDQLGYDYRSWVLLRRHHEVVPLLSNCVLASAVQAVRDRTPARVVYSVEPSLEMSDTDTGLELRYDRAYWVSDVEAANGADKATIDVTSHARADRGRHAERVIDAGQNIVSGADLCGPNPAVQTGDTWRLNGIALTVAPPQAVANEATVVMTAVQSASLELDGMALSTASPLRLTVTADADATLVLRGPWSAGVTLAIDGSSAGAPLLTPAGLTVPVRAGTHTYDLHG